MNHLFFKKFHIKKKPVTLEHREQLETFWLQCNYSLKYKQHKEVYYCYLYKNSQKIGTGIGRTITSSLLSLFVENYDYIDIMDISYIRALFQYPTEGEK